MRAVAVAQFLSIASAYRANSGDEGQHALEKVRPVTITVTRPHDDIAAAQIPGYQAFPGNKCGGTWIEYWDTNDYALYGQSDVGHEYTEFSDCARECDAHELCTGFFSHNGICSHWRSGTLPNTRHSHRHTCYVKSPGFVPPSAEEIAEETSLKSPQGPQISDCLCVFDVSRTLTARSGRTECPGTVEQTGIPDLNYFAGTLILSDLALGLKESVQCGQCYFGLVSYGSASGPGSAFRNVLDSLVEPQFDVGGYVEGCASPVTGTKIMGCTQHAQKERAVRDIVAWLGDNNVNIQHDKVHFFSDQERNVRVFDASPFHAHQVSCASREESTRGGSRGVCGGTRAELDNPSQNTC